METEIILSLLLLIVLLFYMSYRHIKVQKKCEDFENDILETHSTVIELKANQAISRGDLIRVDTSTGEISLDDKHIPIGIALQNAEPNELFNIEWKSVMELEDG